MLNKFKGSYSNMIQSLFPDLKFDPASFLRCTHFYTFFSNLLLSYLFILLLFNSFAASWNTISNRRQFFENFAKMKNFDAEVADNWYSQSRKEIMNQKVLLFPPFLPFLFFLFINNMIRERQE